MKAHYHLGNALRDRGQLSAAIASYRRVLELQPDYPEAHNNLGAALAAQGRIEEAIAEFRQAIALSPGHPEAHLNLGAALVGQNQIDAAMAALRQALALKPDFPEAHLNLGNALRECGRIDEAVAAYRRALGLKPAFPEAHVNLGAALAAQGQLGEALGAYRRAMQLEPKRPLAHSNLIYTLHFCPEHDGATIADEQQRWNRQFGAPLKQFVQPHANDRSPDRRLRVGYVSPDFREHVVGRNLLPLFQRHDYRDFDIFCYSEVVRPDNLTDQFRLRAQQWRSTVGVSDEALAEMIRGDGVDILVDLTQHMDGNRLPMFARKPAPVQASFAGYPESTGLQMIEYRISDRYLVADSADQRTENRELLDTFPYNGHTTNLDALWMGVPVVSLAGKTPVSRAGLSQLTNLGLPELAAHSESEYVSIAESLAGDFPRLAGLRSSLRERMEKSVLMDAPRFARQVEQAYREMWKRWCASMG